MTVLYKFYYKLSVNSDTKIWIWTVCVCVFLLVGKGKYKYVSPTFTRMYPHSHTRPRRSRKTQTFTQISNLVPHISNSIWRSKFNLEGGGVGWSDSWMTEVLRVELQEQRLFLQRLYNSVTTKAPKFGRLPAAPRQLAPAVAETHIFLEFWH